MRARRVGTKSEFRLLQDEREIGRVDRTSVSFVGFETREDAALAAARAHRALQKRRRRMPHRVEPSENFLIMDQGATPTVVAPRGVLATLLPPGSETSGNQGWGFEIELLPEEQFEVFAIARARILWRSLRRAGMHRRMRQFQPRAPQSV